MSGLLAALLALTVVYYVAWLALMWRSVRLLRARPWQQVGAVGEIFQRQTAVALGARAPTGQGGFAALGPLHDSPNNGDRPARDCPV